MVQRRLLIACLAVLTLAATSRDARASRSEIEESGDVLTILLPVTGLAASLFRRDWTGSLQLTGSLVASQVTVEALKLAAEKWRPNDASNASFPSGHSSGGWTGAAFIATRYPGWWNYPVYGLAVWTSYTRVHEQKHFLDDVIAGAAISSFYNWAIVTEYESPKAFQPVYTADRIGFEIDLLADQPKQDPLKGTRGPDDMTWRFEWEFGPTFRTKNNITAPRDTGTTIQHDQFDLTSNPTTTSRVQWEHRHDERNYFSFVLAPFEVRDFGSSNEPINFVGETIPADTAIRSAYLFFEMRFRWRREMLESERHSLKLGAAISYHDTELQLLTETQDLRIEDVVWLPLLHLSYMFQATEKFTLAVEADAIALAHDSFLDGTAFMRYAFNPQWDVSVGYRLVSRYIDTEELLNDFFLQRAYLTIGYSW